MTIWRVLSFLLRCVGLFQWADAAWAHHEAKIAKQSVADSPSTSEELDETLEKHQL